MRPIVIFLAATMFFDSAAALADTLHVPGDYPTIQAAIDAAVDGDEVEIADGTYTGAGNRNLDFGGKAITVRSASGDPSLCIIDCEGEGQGFLFQSGEGEGSVVEGLTITDALHSGIYCTDSSSPAIIDCTITGNSSRYGGGIACYNDSSPTITNCTIRRNSGNSGGGVSCRNKSNPILTDCTITGNDARDGGGIYCFTKSFPTLTGCTIDGNRAQWDGGGIYCSFGSGFTLTNCTIDGNRAAGIGDGGGIYSRSDQRQVLIGCSIDDNAAHFGGGLYLTGSAPRLINCSINRNRALHGGGISCQLGSKPTLSNCSINGNDAESQGGGVLCVDHSSATLRNCTINENSAGVGGGLNCNDRSAPRLIDCEINGNSAEYYGGVVCRKFSSPRLTNCTISGNSSIAPGGGIHLGDHSSPKFTNCRITGNAASSGGGVYCINNCHPTLTNCAINRNVAEIQGGGVFCSDSSHPTLTNCTISRNVADLRGGGFFCRLNSTPTITNTVLWANVPQAIYVHSGDPIVTYCDVQGGWPGEGNIDADPLFVDPDGPDNDPETWGDNDYRLFPGSPCIDAADNEMVPEGVNEDLNGDPRFVDDPATEDTGNGVPPIVDMGPYEFEIRPPVPPRDVLASDGDHEYRVAVTWERAFPADEYLVYRNVENEPDGSEPVSDWQPETEFDDRTVENAQVYWYWVVARNDKGASGFSIADSGFRWEGPPDPPTDVQATDGEYGAYVIIRWEASLTAEDYRVYRNIENDPDNSEPLSAWLTGTLFADRSGEPRQEYSYWVTARSEGGESDWSDGDTGYRACVHDPEWICDGDVSGDGQVNPVDLGMVEANIGNTNSAALCKYDMDCDGQINPVDSGIVQALFGTCEEPRGVCP